MDIKIPNTIKVAGFEYRVSFVDSDQRLAIDSKYGTCDNVLMEIKVETGFHQQHTNETFLHEVIEAVNEQYCNAFLSGDNHKILTNLSKGLHQVMEQLGINFVQE